MGAGRVGSWLARGSDTQLGWSRLLGAAALLFIGTLSPVASAYCRSKACDDKPHYADVWQTEPDPPCTRDGYGCPLYGDLLFWPQTCISFAVHREGSPARGIDYETAHAVIVDAFLTWLNAPCAAGLPSFVISDKGPIACGRAQYNSFHGNANLFTFRDDTWPEEFEPSALAMTSVSYNTETGEMWDADVEINSALHAFSVDDEPQPGATDLAAVITHEVGHLLGLSHTGETEAVMAAVVQPGTKGRRLHPDDIAGICEIYPPGRRVDENRCEPRHLFASECTPEPEPRPSGEGGCSLGPAFPRGSSGESVLAVVALAYLVRRRAELRQRLGVRYGARAAGGARSEFPCYFEDR